MGRADFAEVCFCGNTKKTKTKIKKRFNSEIRIIDDRERSEFYLTQRIHCTHVPELAHFLPVVYQERSLVLLGLVSEHIFNK